MISRVAERFIDEQVRTARRRMSFIDDIDQYDGKRFKTSTKSNSISLLQRRPMIEAVISSGCLHEKV